MDRGAFAVLTTDAIVEGVHFERRFSSAADIGHKALAVNLSDLAAMGAAPRFALLSLMLPVSLAAADVDALVSGLAALARAARVTVAGGNITRSPGPLAVDVTAVGAVKPRKVLTRGGGRAGDELYVSGRIGAGTAGLAWLRAHATSPASEPEEGAIADCVRWYRRPEPRTRLGALLGRARAASACMDLSDGLADAVRQVAAASGVGARIDAATLPVHPGAARWFEASGQDALRASLTGGDDYELLIAVPRRRRGRLRTVISQARGVPLTRIGELTAHPDLVLRRDGALEALPQGFVHF
jgi:thiamine-monophosphate kinase